MIKVSVKTTIVNHGLTRTKLLMTNLKSSRRDNNSIKRNCNQSVKIKMSLKGIKLLLLIKINKTVIVSINEKINNTPKIEMWTTKKKIEIQEIMTKTRKFRSSTLKEV